ncbi:MAG: GNAT family N-acetyltransferase [Gammaproteobacteria bacterium]|nr:GNAT family N-acetyltransferase [Gammaproteobacteria bacterium]
MSPIVHRYPDISKIPAAAWNQLVVDNNPFLRHEFLSALERHNCVGNQFGWQPCHLALYEGGAEKESKGRLLAAMPLYIKANSYGEFVFDHAWADAYARYGKPYFPKLVTAVPYTPSTGQRFVCPVDKVGEFAPLLLQAAQQQALSIEASGLHILFPDPHNRQWLQQQPLIERNDCQFHWFNHDYHSFEQFLEHLSSRKRKKIRRERERVAAAGVTLRRISGDEATAEEWAAFYRFYCLTFEKKWGIATLSLGFFLEIGEKMGDQILLVLAERSGETIAGALMFISDSTLFGRHWGTNSEVHSLHFEACYYQGIEFAIERGLSCFEPGAQGEHKVSRGFIPTRTYSYHWLSQPWFKEAIAHYCVQEREAIDDYITELNQQLPYRRTPSS